MKHMFTGEEVVTPKKITGEDREAVNREARVCMSDIRSIAQSVDQEIYHNRFQNALSLIQRINRETAKAEAALRKITDA